ncbi:hypothetical protein [Bosea sp. TND4EK4]|uniref:hypothetical protein n=1 Tax=Bosea sp. TND4EK4 TaxID=1907408 RepID=UPI000954836B|nr:hypothetical protein [Bosea sp. TND4EK4]SIR56948.1 hypothetical protein SAMN05880592_13210 [Bosea sp. TND4EK4]
MADEGDDNEKNDAEHSSSPPNLIVFPGGRRESRDPHQPRPPEKTTPQEWAPFELLLLAGKPPEKDIDRLRRLADEHLGVFSYNGQGYVFLKELSRGEAWQASSARTSDVLHELFDRDTQRLTGSAPVNAVWRYLERKSAKAPAGGIGRRWCEHAGNIYLDLCDQEGRYVEIDEHGWRLTSNPPVRFEKTANMAPLPMPASGGSIDLLQRYVNVPKGDDFQLVVSFMIGCMVSGLPFPVLQINGGHGTAKTETACFIMRLIDPQNEDPSGLPQGEENLFIAASKTYLSVFDNLSSIEAKESDALCRISTGGSYRTRKFNTNTGQVIIAAHAPVILTAIEPVIGRTDLSSRAITIRLRKPKPRRPMKELLKTFERDRPEILGALLDMLAHALKRLPTMMVDIDHRLVDFILLAAAAETFRWQVGSFQKALEANQRVQNDDLLDHDPVVEMVVRYIKETGVFESTASKLLEALLLFFRDEVGARRTLPGAAHHLSRRLRAKEALLAANGVEMLDFRRGRSGTRILALRSVSTRFETETSAG